MSKQGWKMCVVPCQERFLLVVSTHLNGDAKVTDSGLSVVLHWMNDGDF